jgi:hypothetical protein
VLCGVNPIPVTVAARPRRSDPPSCFSVRYRAFPWFSTPTDFSSSRVVLATPNSIFSQSLLLRPVPVYHSDFLPARGPALLVSVVAHRVEFSSRFFFCRARFPFRPWLSALGFPATCLRFLLVPFNPVAGARRLFSSPARRFLPLGLSCHRQISKFRFRLSVLLVDA